MSQRNGGAWGPTFLEGGALLLPGWKIRVLAAVALTLVQPPGALTGQEPDPAWNTPEVLRLIRDARAVRQGFVEDTTLQSYSSEARGFVYFYLDREDTGERILVKTDQIALEVYWQSPDRFKQRIVGMRDNKSLPTNIQYHLDHLVVVQDEFGDRIRIGDGDEVEAVLHPAAPASESYYDFLLADSVTLNLPATGDTVRVYRVQVKPKDFNLPGFVGTVFLDRATRSIVRMSFTFTPSSYVDEYLDHISISLENGLWLGRHWLPYRQQMEIRREVPFLDVPAGSVIRGSFQVQNYELNPPLAPMLFSGRTVTALPEATRRSFPFEEDIHARLQEEGLAGFSPPPEMDEIRALAVDLAANRALSGIGRSRVFLPEPMISSALRYNRSEGIFAGAGLSHALRPQMGVSAYGGYAFSRERPTLVGRLSVGASSFVTSMEGYLNRPADLGPVSGISGILNSLAGITIAEDFTDLHFATGGRATFSTNRPSGGGLSLSVRHEKHRPGSNAVESENEESDFRPILPTDRGTWTSVSARGRAPLPLEGGTMSAETVVGRFEEDGFGSFSAGLTIRRRWLAGGADLSADLRGGSLWGTPPAQALYYLGGRGTVPGYGYRTVSGDRYWLLRTEASKDLVHPWVRLRAFAAAGGVRVERRRHSTSPPYPLGHQVMASVGIGLGLGWDVLRLDLARGLRDGGDWEFLISVRPDFWPWL